MYNNNDYSRESGSSGHCSSRSRELLVGALSVEEWGYLRGLFLADGNRFHLKDSRDYRVKFDLQGDEGELVYKTAELLKRVGLNPYVLRHPMKNMITVRVVSKSLFDFLPDKKALLRQAYCAQVGQRDFKGLIALASDRSYLGRMRTDYQNLRTNR